MSAADAREELEAVIWRYVTSAEQVDRILDAADDYAIADVAEALDERARASRLTAAEASAAEHRERLERATAERTGRTG